jgi:hypothetical protein
MEAEVIRVNDILENISKYFVLPLGLLCNIFLISVYSCKSFRNLTLSFYLILLSISNSIILILLLFNMIYIEASDKNHSTISFIIYFNECLWEISAWLVALIAIDRVINLNKKNRTSKKMTYHYLTALLIILFILSSNLMILFKTHSFSSEKFLVYKYSYWLDLEINSSKNSCAEISEIDKYSVAQFIKMHVFYFMVPFLFTIICFVMIIVKVFRIKRSYKTYKIRDFKLILITKFSIISYLIVNLPLIFLFTYNLYKITLVLLDYQQPYHFGLFNNREKLNIILLNVFLVLRDCYSIISFFFFLLFNQLFRKEFFTVLKFIQFSNCKTTEDNRHREFLFRAFTHTYLVRVKKENMFTNH